MLNRTIFHNVREEFPLSLAWLRFLSACHLVKKRFFLRARIIAMLLGANGEMLSVKAAGCEGRNVFSAPRFY